MFLQADKVLQIVRNKRKARNKSGLLIELNYSPLESRPNFLEIAIDT